MNRLVFNPTKQIIEQWREIYLKEEQIFMFQQLINKLYVYLDVVLTHKIKFIQKESKKIQLITGEKKVVLDGISLSNKTLVSMQNQSLERHQIEDVYKKTKQIMQLKQTFLLEYDDIFHQNKQMKKRNTQKEQFILNLVAKYKNPDNYKKIQYSKIDFNKFFQIFEGYFSNLEKDILQSYSKFMDRNDQIIQKFVNFKIHTLKSKTSTFKTLIKDILSKQNKKDVSQLNEESYFDIKILFENLFIEGHYLSKFLHYNTSIFDRFEQADNNTALLQPIRKKHEQKMKVLQENLQLVRKEVRDLYISLYDTTRAQRNDPNRLQRFICNQVAVNRCQYQQESRSVTFINGILFAVLLVSLIGILVFRGLALSTLQQRDGYMKEFKIWRGASYLIFMNWVIAIVLSIFQICKINYRLVLLQFDTFVPKPQSFFQTAIILSSVYLILFLIYLLKAMNIIEGYDLIQHLGYFMWLINIVFMLNPFRILNYEGRMYFIKLVGKSLISIFRPMNNNIFFVTLVMCSFVQPFSDFSFTVCSLIYDSNKSCKQQAEIATFAYSFVLLVISIAQNIRCHIQLKTNKTFTGPILSLIAVLFSLNSVFSSLLYNIYLSQGLFIYWIASAIVATLTGINSDIRAHWALVSFSQEDCMLRKYKSVPRKIYFIAMTIDIILNVGWVFTISNNLSFSESINPMYFFMILSYFELSRKGMWMFFRIECDHSSNVGNLNALQNDQIIYTKVLERHFILKKKPSQSDLHINSQDIIRESAGQLNNKQDKPKDIDEKQHSILTIDQLKEEVWKHKQYEESIKELAKQFDNFLQLMHKMYIDLNWQDQI